MTEVSKMAQSVPISLVNRPNGGSTRYLSLACSGHTRPVVDLAFSRLIEKEQNRFFMISACKGEHVRWRSSRYGESHQFD